MLHTMHLQARQRFLSPVHGKISTDGQDKDKVTFEYQYVLMPKRMETTRQTVIGGENFQRRAGSEHVARMCRLPEVYDNCREQR